MSHQDSEFELWHGSETDSPAPQHRLLIAAFVITALASGQVHPYCIVFIGVVGAVAAYWLGMALLWVTAKTMERVIDG